VVQGLSVEALVIVVICRNKRGLNNVSLGFIVSLILPNYVDN
jgi:hypothetical protein